MNQEGISSPAESSYVTSEINKMKRASLFWLALFFLKYFIVLRGA